jgi:hypothetical protein
VVGKGSPQDVEQVAQVGPGLGLAGVGPEQEGQALARLGRLPVEQQVGEQRLGPGRAERRQRGIAEAEVELAEEPDAQDGRCHETRRQAQVRGRRRQNSLPSGSRSTCQRPPS